MPRNIRPKTTVTRSISFDRKVFLAMEARRKALRLDRSTFLRYVLEDQLGILERPFLRSP